MGIFEPVGGLDNIIENNTVSDMIQYGVFMIDRSSRIVSNKISDILEQGVILSGPDNTVTGNTITKCGLGLLILQGGNILYRNNLIDNQTQAEEGNVKNQWDHDSQGNYWSDYTGKDANGDGIGDIPYPVTPNGVDNYPLMSLYEQ